MGKQDGFRLEGNNLALDVRELPFPIGKENSSLLLEIFELDVFSICKNLGDVCISKGSFKALFDSEKNISLESYD